MPAAKRLSLQARRVGRFALRVLSAFLNNRGILLAGGVGYNILLSIIPVFALFAVVLTQIVDERQLLAILDAQAQLLVPGHADQLLEVVESALDSRGLFGVVNSVVLLFVSSMAFRMLEDAISIIFSHREHPPRRSFLLSVLLPFVFMLVLGAGLLTLTVLVSVLEGLGGQGIQLADVEISVSSTAGAAVYLIGFIGVGLLFASIYKVLPVVEISLGRALIGGFVAAALWEITRLVLVYYFVNISLVNVLYGSFATVIIVLIGLEVGAIILLLGAQVIAELERSAAAGIPWYERAGSWRHINTRP